MKVSLFDVVLTLIRKVIKIGCIMLKRKNDCLITKARSLRKIRENSFMGNVPKMINSKIIFKGKNNILYCDKGVVIKNSTLSFYGDNSIIYLNKSKFPYIVNISIYTNSVIHIGSDNYFNTVCHLICSEGKHIFIGNLNLFSHNITFRNADPHLIYSVQNQQRINLSQSIYIGDHVWIGQNCFLLKGAKISSGSILGAASVLSKAVESNSIYAGVPARCIKKDIYWKSDCVHNWDYKKTESSLIDKTSDYVYKYDIEQCIRFETLDDIFDNLNIQEKFNYLKMLNLKISLNRFCMPYAENIQNKI